MVARWLCWSATFGQVANIYGQLPPEWTTHSPVYRAIATNPLPVVTGGATLALVLLGLRTLQLPVRGGQPHRTIVTSCEKCAAVWSSPQREGDQGVNL